MPENTHTALSSVKGLIVAVPAGYGEPKSALPLVYSLPSVTLEASSLGKKSEGLIGVTASTTPEARPLFLLYQTVTAC